MILVIDTSLPGIGLLLDNKFIHIDTITQSLDLPSAVENFIDGKWKDLTAIAVVVGPGSFTGIRLGIAYAKGVALGLDIPCIGISAFDIYLQKNPDAFVAIDSGKGDFFVAAQNLAPTVMTIDEIETKQFEYAKTVGHKPYDLADALPVVLHKLNEEAQPIIPMYLKPSYAEKSCKSSS